MSFIVYILKSLKNEKYYIGQTADVEKRLLQHNKGLSRSTKPDAPWKVVYQEMFPSRREAIQRERFLKSPSGWKEWKEIKTNLLS